MFVPRLRVVPLIVLGGALAGACGLDAVGRLGADGGGPSPKADGASAMDGGGDGSEVHLPGVDAADDSGEGGNDGGAVKPACDPGKVHCGGACVTANDCTGCSSAPYLCAPTRACVASCGGCTDLVGVAMPIECHACDDGQNNPIASCGYDSVSGFCLSGDYSKAYQGGAGEHCDCSDTDVSNCPGRSQVCKPKGGTDWCITCGEAGESTNGLPCKGGGNCNTGVSPPRCM